MLHGPCAAAVNGAVDVRLDTNEPSRRDGAAVGKPARCGAITKAWLAPNRAERAKTRVHTKYCI